MAERVGGGKPPPQGGLTRLDGSANIPPHGIEANFLNLPAARQVKLRGFQVVQLKIGSLSHVRCADSLTKSRFKIGVALGAHEGVAASSTPKGEGCYFGDGAA